MVVHRWLKLRQLWPTRLLKLLSSLLILSLEQIAIDVSVVGECGKSWSNERRYAISEGKLLEREVFEEKAECYTSKAITGVKAGGKKREERNISNPEERCGF